MVSLNYNHKSKRVNGGGNMLLARNDSKLDCRMYPICDINNIVRNLESIIDYNNCHIDTFEPKYHFEVVMYKDKLTVMDEC